MNTQVGPVWLYMKLASSTLKTLFCCFGAFFPHYNYYMLHYVQIYIFTLPLKFLDIMLKCIYNHMQSIILYCVFAHKSCQESVLSVTKHLFWCIAFGSTHNVLSGEIYSTSLKVKHKNVPKMTQNDPKYE